MYVEEPACVSLRSLLTCTWTRAATQETRARIVPDACIDIVWTGTDLFVAGPDTHAVARTMAAGARYAGVRFAPGTASTLLGVPASALRDARVPLRDLWGDDARRLSDQLAARARPGELVRLLEGAVQARPRAQALDPLVARVLARLTHEPALPLARLAAELGVGERQLLRRCTAAFGYGPKLLARVLRFQRALRALRSDRESSLATIAAAHGYADQAHLAHEMRALGGASPSAFRAEARDVRSRQDAAGRSDPD